MNEMIAGLVLFGGIILGWSVARKIGFFAPASIYIWFVSADLALFLIIVSARLDRTNYTFTAIPWPAFDSVFLPTVLIYGVLILAGWLSAFKLRRPKLPTDAKGKTWKALPGNRKNFRFLLWGFLILVTLIEIFHFSSIDKSILWQNQKYLTINNPTSAGIDTLVGRWVHFLLRPLGLLLVSAGTFFWIHHRRQTAANFFLLSIYPFLIAFAQNSRWAPLYVAGMLVVIVFYGNIKRYFFTVLAGGILGFLLFLKVLIGRSMPYQGLGGTDDVFRIIFSNAQSGQWVVGFLLNILQGAQSLANALLIRPQYPEVYKLLSFSPTISAIDHFDKIMNVYMVKIAPVVPMNTYSEAYFFGAPYFLFLLIILIVWLRTMTKLFLRKDMIGTAFTVFSYWVIFYISQYAVRNSMRLVYLSLLVGILVNRALSAKAKIRARKIAHEMPYKEAEGKA